MSTSNDTALNKWYQKLWPIQSFELKKIVPLLLLKFFISFNYAILTCLKDTLVVTAEGSGAEVIPVLKGWVVLPVAIAAAIFYSKLCNHFRRTTIFYAVITAFLLFLLFFAYYLFPNIEALSPHESANWLTSIIGEKFNHWVAIYRNWIPTVFFVSAELWGQLVIFLLFWGFTNQITKIGEAKRTYTLFIAAGDLASMMTGYLVLHYVKKYSGLDFRYTLQSLVLFICFFGILIMGVFWWLNKYVINDTKFYNPIEIKKIINRKTKLSLTNSIKHIA
ncbi:MAG: translocase, partial [Simkaniaceae bacterium]|nr:translocase [Simkaniaceae bacterium]